MIRRNVLIFHSGGLGDFVLTWPLGLALGRLHPQSRIIYITQASKGELVARAVRLDWQDAETGWPALHGDVTNLSERCRKTLTEAHSIYTFLSAHGDEWFANVAAIAPETAVTCLRSPPPAEFKGHAVENLLSQLAGAPAVKTAVEQILASIAAKGVGNRKQLAGGPVIVHPGSGGREKCYPVEEFVRMIEKIKTDGKDLKVVLGEVELERFSASEVRQLESVSPVVRPGKYVDLMELVSGSSGFIGNDSGPSHLAGILGVPTVGLFRTTNPMVWRPLGPRVEVVRGPILDVDEVFRALERVRVAGI